MWGRLLASRGRMAVRSFVPRAGGGGRATAAWAGAALALALGALIGLALVGLFEAVASGPDARDVSVTVLGLVLGTAFAGLLVFDLHDAVSTLVADSDLSLLRRAPIGAGTLMSLKLVDALPRTAPAVIGVALPATLAYWHVHPPEPWGWLVLPWVMAALWAMPLGLGVSAALVLLGAVPARRAREGLAMLATITLLAVWVVNALLLPRLAANERATGDLASAVRGMNGSQSWSPGAWAARAIAAPAAGDGGQALGALGVLAAASMASLALAWLAASRRLDVVQSRVIGSGAARRDRRRPRVAGPAPPARPRPIVAALLGRDARLYARDWATLADVLTATVLWTLLPLVAAPLLDVPRTLVARAMLLALTVGLGYEIAARAIPLERRGLAWMRLAPVSGRAWITSRFLSSGALATMLFAAGAAATLAALRVAATDVIALLCLAVPALGLALATGLWTGAVYGDPDWRSARGMLTLPGRLAATALLLVQAGGWLLLSALADAGAPTLPPGIALWGPALLAAPLAWLLLGNAAQRVRRPQG